MLLLLTLFAALQFVSCNSSSNIDIIVSEIEKKERLINELTNEISIYNGLSEDFQKAKDNLIDLAELEKSQQRFWSNIVVNTENIYSNWSRKFSRYQCRHNRLFTTLRNLCSSNNISVESDSQNNINSFTLVPKEKTKKYGFGLSSYDGFWPSFSQEESMLLGIQSKIISSIVQFLSQSGNSEQRITLVHILRESVGDEDKQHIGMDLLKLPDLNSQLIRFNGGIRSFAFEIKFKGHTSHARSFINQLRPPFILRDLIINRVSTPTFNRIPMHWTLFQLKILNLHNPYQLFKMLCLLLLC